MKKNRFIALTMAFVALVTFTACSSDDNGGEDGGGTGSNTVPSSCVIKTKDGTRVLLASWGFSEDDTEFSYMHDNYGRCTLLTRGAPEEDYSLSFGWEDKKITDNITDKLYDMTLNKSGYITRLINNFNYVLNGKTYKGTTEINMEYDNLDHLTKIIYNQQGNTTEKSEVTPHKYYAVLTNTWTGGLMTKSELYEVYGSVSKPSYGKTWQTYDYSETPNYNNTYLAATGYRGVLEMSIYSQVGLLGKGTSMLPKRVCLQSDNGYSEYRDCHYTLNSDGTVRIEQYGKSYYYYNYIPFNGK